MRKITKKLLNWASILDETTKEQALKTSRLSIIYPHLVLMADAHLGKGSTVGSVIPTLKTIIPAAVGVDIGCGMVAVETGFKVSDLAGRDLSKLRHSIERSIPLSAGHYNRELTEGAKQKVRQLAGKAGKDYKKFAPNWPLQLGSLGSGNHFVEISRDEKNNVWLFLHSGSRGLGNKIATYHINKAKKLMAGKTLEDPDLAYFEEGTAEFADYVRDLLWAQEFAYLNREEMLERMIKDLGFFMGREVKEITRINAHHNFAQKEKHYGRELWISRKGAIEAKAGQPGLIPGSMGTKSYVVVGKGNKESLNSAPHGAGRRFSRSEAKRRFTMENLKASMKGIEYHELPAFIDEIPAAYKDIDRVMKDSADLVEIKHTLNQIINIKGE